MIQLYIYIYIYPLFLRFFSHIGYYRVLNRVPSFLYVYIVYVNPKLLIYPSPPPFPFGNHKFVFEVCESPSSLESTFHYTSVETDMLKLLYNTEHLSLKITMPAESVSISLGHNRVNSTKFFFVTPSSPF